MKITITNKSAVANPADIFLMLTGDNFTGSGITIGTPTPLSSLTNNSFDVTRIDSGRLYISYYTKLPKNPAPTSNNYYGYIELTLGTNNVLWTDLSSVDVFGVPIAMTIGSHKLGYSKSHNTIVKNIATALGGTNGAAVQRKNGKGNTKVVGANVLFANQPPYDAYLKTLQGKPLTIKNVPSSPITYDFTGSFTNKGGISLTSTSPKLTFEIPATDLNNKTIYLSNGNCVYNGKPRNAMFPNDVCAAVYRDIMVGINEGYFSAKGPNDSSLFPKMTPFKNGHGNVYAKLIHEGSDSYGYPFSDKNLKTLIQVPVTNTSNLELTILEDDKIS
ncbi:beta-1,3-glucanase family protein [uncultured Dokdonia sp.]|uniref:beta-1,3-glucanase family protein n=1 Tax=uncultured Dokdonia sp. TaxID=575653 RepID=UPI00261F08BD|nr:beta-1,3-glucanase family protein [uncultured Dokdonia sp.]